MFVENSKDILYLVISFCVLWVTVFICWVFYYVMRLLRNTNKIVEEFRLKLHTISETINYIRGKVEHMSDLLGFARSGVGGLVKKVVTRKANEWLDDTSTGLNSYAKQAVEKAVEVTASKMRKVTKKVKK